MTMLLQFVNRRRFIGLVWRRVVTSPGQPAPAWWRVLLTTCCAGWPAWRVEIVMRSAEKSAGALVFFALSLYFVPVGIYSGCGLASSQSTTTHHATQAL